MNPAGRAGLVGAFLLMGAFPTGSWPGVVRRMVSRAVDAGTTLGVGVFGTGTVFLAVGRADLTATFLALLGAALVVFLTTAVFLAAVFRVLFPVAFFLATFFLATFFPVVFLTAFFFTTFFFAALFLVALFLAVFFFAVVFLALFFLVIFFLAGDFFTPDFRVLLFLVLAITETPYSRGPEGG